ncbi:MULTISPECIES: glutathione S-transferase [unclassified Pseudoxanthomonas]|jgi:glutathione S-transferase|uniref:glutathione S-transferase n=1 Tax=unclassified Pseudoxanthomonas TaxID=2645906 RepID=UPI00161766B6|nr:MULTISPECIES: glutathione S-transferase [unclassified Pseudoxanthomonas]MBB3277050.1 glutathione S-transferase [Pseudoxanthomonas sp. OG2]MBD9376640.1 glutathione S-transferase [Pseudoxanthomonas sp. PXM04]MBV7475659.1 glutathione S-transferase [Pseudoxanthomonas sp. PXM05]UBB26588.1 glutathione S-transferase [Pseudoxanthomonas japonensis]
MITVHHLNNSRSQRVLWLLEELGLDYTVVRYQRDPQTLLAPPSLRAVHPLGKSPVLVDGGNTLAESGAVLEYLVERYDAARAFAPSPGTAEHLRYRYWLHYAEGSAMPPMLLSLVFSRLKKAPMPFFARPIARSIADKALQGFVAPQVRLHLDYMEAELGKARWFAGENFSAADIQMSFPVEAAAARTGLERHPKLADFLARIHARPAYQRALEQGGPFDLLS